MEGLRSTVLNVGPLPELTTAPWTMKHRDGGSGGGESGKACGAARATAYLGTRADGRDRRCVQVR